MKLRTFLIVAPVTLLLIMWQSYFWVPTYDSQTQASPARLTKFIEASRGDAKILNPILHADTASARIVDLVFEGLLFVDDDLQLAGRLASRWELRETAYLLVNEFAYFPDGTPVTAAALVERFEGAQQDSNLALAKSVRSIRLLPATRRSHSLPGMGDAAERSISIEVPARIEFALREVDQDFFSKLTPIIGEHYTDSVDLRRFVRQGDDRLDDSTLAQLLPVLEHNPVIEFELRRGVRFHDGHEFDAGDVKFTYEAIMDPKNLSPRTSDFEPIKSVDILDLHRVRVTYKRLFSPAVNAWTMGILPEHLLNEAALAREITARDLTQEAARNFGLRESSFNRAPIGTGPFKFRQWQGDELIHLSRFQTYWGTPPIYEDFHYRVIPDALTQELEFRAGAVDTYQPEPHQVDRYLDNPLYRPLATLRPGYTYIGYNNRRPLFADPRVRRALGMAINTQEIIDYVLYGQGARTTGPYPKPTLWYDKDVAALPYDPDAAVALLGSLGWKKNGDGWLEKDGKVFEFNLITNNGNLARKSILSIAQNAWKKIGVKCNTQVFEWAVFLKDFVNPGQFDAVVLGWLLGIDPDLYQLWHSSQSGENQLNFIGYDNRAADDLLDQIRKEYDPAAQRRLTHRLHQLIAAEQPYTFLYAPRVTRVLDRKIVMINADGEPVPPRPGANGDEFFHMRRWTKLAHAPNF